jgi:hypothetical protein
MYNNFRPTGSVIQLMDGRVFKRNQKNLWEDINTGVTITEQQLGTMISSANFSSDASGGGRTNRKNTFVPDYTATQREWGDINGLNYGVEAFNSNQIISGINAPIEIRLSFENTTSGGNAVYAATSSLKVYKNDILIDTISTNTRPTKSGDGAGLYTLSETFSNNDTLKFGAISTTDINYDIVSVQNKTEGGSSISLTGITVIISELG